MAGIPENVRTGMDVYDSADEHIGTVEDLKFGQAEATTTAGQETEHDETLVDALKSALWPSDMPEAQRARLLREGYVLLDADGILQKDRYILPDQIKEVAGDRLVLNVRRDDLATA
ncbi:DUF2171 domain-containing protein [Pelagibacterium xiamenense]|uniref:DUF2171 domain-containing protein n=1 Tax=Pelagibacterium xiamenense TaxID=2901140 RepID=UPI001E2BDD70|nr:DUF2171 domain-containing protein [Pelagibacterium xiamenense]MCD7058647.1 DUF2171 domain-containing protein [Pelagibacterium xiamenense]